MVSFKAKQRELELAVVRQHELFLTDHTMAKVRSALEDNGLSPAAAYLLFWTPEQTSDIYDFVVLRDRTRLEFAVLEIERVGGAVEFSLSPAPTQIKGELGRHFRAIRSIIASQTGRDRSKDETPAPMPSNLEK